jgi:cytochrome c oxidase subunit 2
MFGLEHLPALLQSGIVPRGTRVFVFQRIYWVFLTLGTIVGIVVVSYMLYNAYTYREGGEKARSIEIDRPQLGELPSGSGGGRKLFLSFALSAIIVISLIAWTYGTLLFVEEGAAQGSAAMDDGQAQDPIEIEVVGYQFGWQFVYPNGKTLDTGAGDAMRVPANRMVKLNVTSRDVMHNFGIPDLRAKTDAMPGQYTQTWFIAEEPGATHTARCYELCGAGHSYMTAEIQVMSQSDFQDWYTSSEEDGNGNESASMTTQPPTASA